MDKKIQGMMVSFYLDDDGLINDRNGLHVIAQNAKEAIEMAGKKIKEINVEAQKNKGAKVIVSSYRRLAFGTLGKEDGNQVWVVLDKDNERMKARKDDIYKYEENLATIENITRLESEIETKEDEVIRLKASLINFYEDKK